MALAEREDPYLGFRFHVELDALIVGGFSSVGGLEHQLNPEEYEEGGNNRFTHKLPTRYTQPNLELQRGITDSNKLQKWLELRREGQFTEDGGRKTIRIHLLNSLGEEPITWTVENAYPVRWAGPEFQADQGAVAIETLELAHEGFTRTA